MAETFFYLTTTGRKTGSPHKIEIWFVEYNACFYLCAEKKYNADWVQNIQQTPQVTYYTAQGKDVLPEQEFNGQAQVIDNGGDTEKAVKALFDAKYNWSNGLIVEICQT